MRSIHIIILLSFVSSLFLAACGSSRNFRFSNATPGEQNTTLPQSNEPRKILYSSTLTLLVENPDSTMGPIREIASRFDGYVNETGTSRSIIRIKHEFMENALDALSQLGKVEYRHLSGQDVTEEYHDLQIRLENAEKARERYLDLLARAENVEAALKVEKELERLNETIDLLKGKINLTDHLAEFSTITINLKEKPKPGILGYAGLGIYNAVKWLFVRN